MPKKFDARMHYQWWEDPVTKKNT